MKLSLRVLENFYNKNKWPHCLYSQESFGNKVFVQVCLTPQSVLGVGKLLASACFVNEVLGEHSHGFLFAYCQRLPLPYSGGAG